MSTGDLAHLTQEERAEIGRQALRRAGWAVSSPPPRPLAPRSAAGLDNPKVIAYLLEDLRSTNEGRRLGRQFQHDAFALASSLGVAVQYVPLAQLQNPNRPSVTISGRLFNLPGWPVVQLADTLKGRELHRVLAHELGHFLGFPDEKLCNQFADAFLKIADDELPGAAWRKIVAERLERARSRGEKLTRQSASWGIGV